MKPKLTLSTLALFVFLAGSAGAATLTVVNANDSGAGSLRGTIAAAAAGDTIDFTPALNGQTIFLTSGDLGISKNLTRNTAPLRWKPISKRRQRLENFAVSPFSVPGRV